MIASIVVSGIVLVVVIVFLPLGVIGLAALAAGGDADQAAGRDEMGEG